MSASRPVCRALRAAQRIRPLSAAAPRRPSFFTNLHLRRYSAVSAAELQFGQPVHETHPHILEAGEITPGVTAQEYWERRARLAEKLPDNGVAVLVAADLKYRSGAVFFPYRQESNFLYLTGWNESDSVAVIQKTGKNFGDFIFHLFTKPKDPVAEQWMGPRNGVQAAVDIFNADKAADIAKIDRHLPEILKGASRVYADIEKPRQGEQEGKLWQLMKADKSWFPSAKLPLYPLVNSLRAIKSPAEVTNMRRAGQISGRVITDAMRRSWTREKDLHAFLDYRFTADGCDGPAYVPVVAGGQNGLCIHYVVNNNVLRDGEMVLVDAGGEYGTYITDISRTWPVNGKFTPEQRDLYEAVLTVQRSSISLCRENANLSLDDIHDHTSAGLLEQLKCLGFDITTRDIDVLFPHHVGHYIGLDVHDVPGYGRKTPLKKGHCVTIEPGIYVPDTDRWPEHFRGLGVRIEDSICVDEDSPYILTTEAVKEIADIEALRD
ncbi:metallopeptidase family M24 [Colletotrichum graminicola]|uniref:Xaa-Pro aminopeptidase n=1 Tax=Colletotrichum graminicola (strain M1.001 / M2 / FGSC 10212) TaxID=645133 RepID=E3QRN1_COLGM|nr:metallopeptidase family M24 [Colletotrichum graminicola M1.001]EFQ33519.1 metallopeptidase family M24 [Colletotrichum graminicola M1.001]WDK22289.1 metallopeptidase family M24 [Colletotrichum graminicola]